MALIKRRGNGNLFPTLHSNLSELFDIDRFFDEPAFGSSLMRGFARVPATNIIEEDDEYVVELAAPGLKKKDFQVDIDNNMLEIKVEKEEESTEKEANYTRREYDYSAFYRSFALPDTVKAEEIKAEYEDGVLKVHLPKVAEAKRKPVKEIAVA